MAQSDDAAEPEADLAVAADARVVLFYGKVARLAVDAEDVVERDQPQAHSLLSLSRRGRVEEDVRRGLGVDVYVILAPPCIFRMENR